MHNLPNYKGPQNSAFPISEGNTHTFGTGKIEDFQHIDDNNEKLPVVHGSQETNVYVVMHRAANTCSITLC